MKSDHTKLYRAMKDAQHRLNNFSFNVSVILCQKSNKRYETSYGKRLKRNQLNQSLLAIKEATEALTIKEDYFRLKWENSLTLEGKHDYCLTEGLKKIKDNFVYKEYFSQRFLLQIASFSLSKTSISNIPTNVHPTIFETFPIYSTVTYLLKTPRYRFLQTLVH